MKYLDSAIVAATGLACTTVLLIHDKTGPAWGLLAATFALVAILNGAKTRTTPTTKPKTPTT